MVLVRDLAVSELAEGLDPRLFDVLPEYCSDCDSPMDINLTLTELVCSNPNCSGKVVIRILKMCQAYGIKDFGESRIESWVEEEDISNPLELFSFESGDTIPGISDAIIQKVVPQIVSAKRVKLWEFLANAQLPWIQGSAKKLLEGYSDLEDFLLDVKDGGISFVQERLGIGDQYDDFGREVYSKNAVKVYNSLMLHYEELLEGASYFEIIEENHDLIPILLVASDTVGGDFKTKKEFYNFVKERYKDYLDITIGTSVTKKTDYVIWAGFKDMNNTTLPMTSKVRKTIEYYNKGVNIDGLAADEFIQAMDKRFNLV